MTIKLGSVTTGINGAVISSVTTATPITATRLSNGETLPFPLSITLTPGASGTLLAEYRTSATGAWVACPVGTASAVTTFVVNGPTQALRFTAGTSTGTVEIAR